MQSILGTARRADVIFRANGQFDITSRVVKSLNMSPGDTIDILSDGREYYLYISCRAVNIAYGRFETQCFPSCGRNSHHFRGYSRRLCKAILEICGLHTRAALPCGEPIIDHTGRTLIPIITRTPI